MDLCKVNFYINKVFIQCNRGSYCVHNAGGVNIYLYTCVSLLVLVCPVYVCLYAWYQIRVLAKPCHPCQTFSKLDSLLQNTQGVLPGLRYQGLTSLVHNIIKQYNILDLAWSHIQPKKNNATKRVEGGGGQNLRKGGGGVLHEIWGDRDPLSTI